MKNVLTILATCTVFAATGLQAEEASVDPFICAATPKAVVSLNHGSRYVAADKSRSEFDEAANDDVNAQLKPVDAFITDLANAANRALSHPGDRKAAVDCVLSGLANWAGADALSDLSTMNAQLSAPSRIAGLAFAYAQVKPIAEPSDDPAAADQALIEEWLIARARATMTYFDTEAPPNASRNNLRAWAALAVARIGLTVEDAAMIDWADASVRLVVCQAAADGSLPLEMARRDLALHYQLHAVTPLVVTAALLQARGHDLFMACDRALHRTVGFTLDAFDNPKLVETLSGKPQSYFDGSEKLRGFELAWAEAYLSLFYAPRLTAFVASYGALGNSKLGGKQSLLWAM